MLHSRCKNQLLSNSHAWIFVNIQKIDSIVNFAWFSVSISIPVMKAWFWKSFCSVQIFNAIPSVSFSAPAEQRTFVPRDLKWCSLFKPELPSFIKAVLKHPRRPTLSGSLEWQFGKAKSSRSLRGFPKSFEPSKLYRYFLVLSYFCLTEARWYPLVPFWSGNKIMLKWFGLSGYTLSLEKNNVKEMNGKKSGGEQRYLEELTVWLGRFYIIFCQAVDKVLALQVFFYLRGSFFIEYTQQPLMSWIIIYV